MLVIAQQSLSHKYLSNMVMVCEPQIRWGRSLWLQCRYKPLEGDADALADHCPPEGQPAIWSFF